MFPGKGKQLAKHSERKKATSPTFVVTSGQATNSPNSPTRRERKAKMHVVIVGGGLVGMSVLRTLAKSGMKEEPTLKITLIDPKSYVEVRWAAIRAMFDVRMNQSIIAPYSTILPPFGTMVSVITATATSIDPSNQTIHLLHAESPPVTYDVCLVTTGSITTEAVLTPQLSMTHGATESQSITDRQASLTEYGGRLLKAKHVLVIGGGPIGCELAGDVAGFDTNRNVKVTLVQSTTFLLPGWGERASHLVRKQLEKLQVHIKTGVKAYKVNETTYELRSNDQLEGQGETIQADMVFLGNGVKAAAPRLIMSPSSMNDDGYFLTDSYGRVQACGGRVFAFGDCVQGDFKSAAAVLPLKKAIAHNLLAVAKQEGQHADSAYALTEARADVGKIQGVVTTGPSSGVAVMPFGTTPFIVPYVKNKTMFLFKAKADIGF